MSRLIAVDLGRHTVKVTVLKMSSRNSVIEGRFSEPVQLQERYADPEWTARLAAFARLIQKNPSWNSGSEYVIAWPGDAATVRRLRLPFTDRAHIERTLPFAVEEEVPFDLDDMLLTFKVLGGVGQSDVLVALARTEAVRGLLDLLAEQKIDPKYIFLDVDPLASYAPREGVTAVLDLGHELTSVAVVRDGALQWSRTLNVGGRHFIEALASVIDLTVAPEALLAGDGLGAATWADWPLAAKEAISAPLGLMLTELRSSLIVAEDVLGNEITQVRLCGGLAQFGTLRNLLETDLGVAVEPVTTEDGTLVPAVHALADALAYRVAAGATGTSLNFRVGELAFRGGADIGAFLGFGAAGLAFFAVASLALFGWKFQQLSQELTERQARTTELMLKIVPDADPNAVLEGRAVSVVTDKVTDAKAKAKAFDRSTSPPTVDALTRISEAFPPKGQGAVDVTEITLTPNNISFNAEADGYTSAAAGEESLRRVEAFGQATKGNEKKNRDKVNFTINIPLGAIETVAGEGG